MATNMDQPLQASVVIPAYNASRTIGECLIALAAQTVPQSAYEVIVVDDGSSDDTAAIAERHGAQVLRQANSGPAAARNRGIAAARGEVILFTDADCAPAPDWIEQMLAPLADPQITGSKGVYRTRQRSLAARFIQIEYEERYDHTAKHTYIDFIDTYAAAYRRDALLASGGFSTRFPFASVEDQELSFRLARAGHKMLFNPRAVVYHQHPESWVHYARRKFKIGYWKTLVLRWHPDKAWRDSHTPSSLKVQLVLAALSAPLAVVSVLARPAVWWLALDLATFAASAVPFVVKAWRRDRPLAWLSVPALYVRAWALGLGLVGGYVALLLRRGPLAADER
jgi:cellulose synthase/poly-beta-1,6-N-acetylglucosamine synthase-like glycosyltransferase